MNCGKETDGKFFPQTFYITLLRLDSILKRVSLKDAVLFKNHNLEYTMTSDLFCSSVCFNLFSEHGIGMYIEPILKDLLKNIEIDGGKYLDNIYYKEVINLTPILTEVVRNLNPEHETNWSYNYAIENFTKRDTISFDRFSRLYSLIIKYDNEGDSMVEEEFGNNSENTEENNDSLEQETYEPCLCGFCEEFRRYFYRRDKSADEVILEVLENIIKYS